GDGDEPPPIRIAAVHGGLDERRVGDRPRGAAGVIVGRRADDTDGHQLGGSLAAADDADGERLADGPQCLDEQGFVAVTEARAAAAPPSRARPAAAVVMPRATLAMSSLTPMTPVDATSTWSGSAPSTAAVAVAIASACARPSSPVQALAQPLFATIARTSPDD